jgi:hypothetical protein
LLRVSCPTVALGEGCDKETPSLSIDYGPIEKK